ncbi:ATP-binding cassette domain-containing protein, partial [Amycolatopsis lexingtonensis]|uniref:ATP-binding cassette domain-containing protein n=1 Tax=Amycolatopsis lexingtonensis TaxID=218822 RepID=UPI002011D1F3
MRETDIQAVAAGAAIHLTGLRKHYGDVHAVDGLDLTIAPGEVVALLGPNGAGKSTTVDMILGLTSPGAGEVRVFGRKPIDAVRAGLIGAMLQGGALMDDLTVAETVGMVAALHRRPMPVAEALRAAVGSSRISRSGLLTRAMAKRTRCFCPPDSLFARRPASSSTPAALHRRPMPVAEALRAAGVEELAGRRANKLSGGQKQRVRFAIALVS